METANPSNTAIVCPFSIEIAVMRQPKCHGTIVVQRIASGRIRGRQEIISHRHVQIDDIQAPQLIANISIPHPVDPNPLNPLK
jgi:hypothetical protein